MVRGGLIECAGMDALLVAVASAAFGALVAGAANLWLAQRTERRLARAGASQLKTELESARQRIATCVEMDTWWDERLTPATPAWDIYQQALIAQLAPQRIEKIQGAVQQLRRVILAAAGRHEAFALLDAAFQQKKNAAIQSASQRGIDDPEQWVKQDETLQRGLKALEPSLKLDPGDDKELLFPTISSLDSALRGLEGLETVPELRAWWWRRSALYGIAWNRLVIGGLLVAIASLVALSWGLAPEAEISSTSAATVLAGHLKGASAVECEAIAAGSAWTCVASYDPSGFAGLEEYEAKRLNSRREILVAETAASGDRLEPDDRHPLPDGTGLRDGMVAIQADDTGDIFTLTVPDPGKSWP
jgi:hypothetical protein